jgi:hypothetical protein
VVALMVSLVVIVSLQFVDRHFVDTGIAARISTRAWAGLAHIHRFCDRRARPL